MFIPQIMYNWIKVHVDILAPPWCVVIETLVAVIDTEARAWFCYHCVVISGHESIRIFSLRLGHEALSPTLHAFSSETPNSIINSSLFLERLRTRIRARACARPGRSHYLTWARCRRRILRSRSARTPRRHPAPWGPCTHRGRGPCRPPIHHNMYHHRQSRSGHRWDRAAGDFR